MLDDLPLYFATLLLLLHLGRLNLWRGALGGVLISVTAAWIGGRYNALSVYLSATAAVTVIGKFGKKRYAAAALLCSELALFASGLWVRQLLLFLIPPLAAGIYLLLPDPTPHPPTKQELSLQYQAMVRKVDSLQETASSRIAFYPEIAARASKLLAESGATNVRTTCAKDLLGGFFLDVTFVQGEYPLSPSAVLGLMERAGGFTLAASKYQEREKEIYACFIRRPPLVVRCAALCKTKEGEAVCGDNAIAFGSDQRHYVLLLSDGMGSGKNAFVQSRWTITLLQKLLRAGMSIESAVGMVHSTLKLPQQEVAFATADICSIDLVSGTAQFLKAGAVSTFILRKNRIMEVCGISMPLGATEEPDVVKQTQKLQEGDLILLISDGAFEHKDEILYTLERHRSLPLKELAARLMHAALGEEGQAEDDITVLLAQICKHREENYEHKTQQT